MATSQSSGRIGLARRAPLRPTVNCRSPAVEVRAPHPQEIANAAAVAGGVGVIVSVVVRASKAIGGDRAKITGTVSIRGSVAVIVRNRRRHPGAWSRVDV